MSDRSRLRLIVMQVLVCRCWSRCSDGCGSSRSTPAAEYQHGGREHPPAGGHRGGPRQILDDKGRLLVTNRTTLAVTVDPPPSDDDPPPSAAAARHPARAKLEDHRGQPRRRHHRVRTPGAKAYVCWTGTQFQPIPVAKDVSEQLALSILERAEDYPGVTRQLETERAYPAPYSANAAHELGYVGPVTQNELDASKGDTNPLQSSDLVGRTGLEAQYDSVLRGVDGIKQLSVDRARNVTGVVGETPAAGRRQPGHEHRLAGAGRARAAAGRRRAARPRARPTPAATTTRRTRRPASSWTSPTAHVDRDGEPADVRPVHLGRRDHRRRSSRR